MSQVEFLTIKIGRSLADRVWAVLQTGLASNYTINISSVGMGSFQRCTTDKYLEDVNDYEAGMVLYLAKVSVQSHKQVPRG